MRRYLMGFDEGCLYLAGESSASEPPPWSSFIWDERFLQWRAPANAYRDIMLAYHQKKEEPADFELVDEARQYERLSLPLKHDITPRPHQAKALAAWQEKGSYGVVSLPTGAGKTILAVMAIAKVNRPTLVAVPTLDLVDQWREILSHYFGQEIGVLGGGERVVRPLTVATYNTASMVMEQQGHGFGFLICDECHHLPAPQFKHLGLASIAPYRLGLSATVERPDGGEALIYELLGPLCFQGHIGEMVDKVLAPYDVVTLDIPLTEKEREDYQEARGVYTGFLRRNGINMSSGQGWGDFIKASSFRPGGRAAMKAYQLQKRTAQNASLKIEKLWELLKEHRAERVLIFTNDNELAYRIGRQLLLPVLTHQTKSKERQSFLQGFRDGHFSALVTSKVLNEGVDVPEASVGIIVSGSSGVREHVQRLGRILRHRPGKRAILYELISKDTGEHFVKERRRKHSAYQGSP